MSEYSCSNCKTNSHPTIDCYSDSLDEILIDLAHRSNHLTERYEFEESILHEGTHLNNAKQQLQSHITDTIYDYCMVHYGVADKEQIEKWLQSA